jgi:hypothetical protein
MHTLQRETGSCCLRATEKSFERAISTEISVVNLWARTKIHDRSNEIIMKTFNYHRRNAFILMIACVLFLSGYATDQAMGSDAQSRRGPVARSADVQPVGDGARLIIRRIPNLGNRVVVNLFVDGVAVAAIGYGHTYEGFLRPGRHVLAVVATPNPKWPTPMPIPLDVRNGQTYSFTAMGDHSGHLILKGG